MDLYPPERNLSCRTAGSQTVVNKMNRPKGLQSHAFNEFVPYYYQIAGLLERKIEEGEFLQGSKLPNELELARLFRVSRVTVRHALAVLHAKGMLLRQRGRGTFISENLAKPKTVSLNGFIEDFTLEAQGRETRLLSADSVPCPPELSEFFGISAGDPISRVQRVGIVDGRPFSYVTHFLPPRLTKRIPARDLRLRSMSKIFEDRLGYTIGEYYQTIEARIADHRISELLGVSITSPVVYVETYSRSDKGEALEFFRSYYPSARYKYAVVLRKDGVRSVPGRDAPARSTNGHPGQ